LSRAPADRRRRGFRRRVRFSNLLVLAGPSTLVRERPRSHRHHRDLVAGRILMALRVGLIGAGAMGSLHARVLAGAEATELAWIADPDRESGERVAARFGT